ncbi:beta strand repeat-containing protein, partial [Flavobacterium myungsuense]
MKNFTFNMISNFKNLLNTIFNTANVEFLTVADLKYSTLPKKIYLQKGDFQSKRFVLKSVWLTAMFVFISIAGWGQTTVTYTMQDANFPTQFNSGGDFYNSGATALGMYANFGSKQTVAWRTYKTAGDNTGSDRALRVGDVFKITVSCTRAFGQIGFSLNAAGTQGTSYANNISGSRLYVNTDNYGSWYVNRSGGTTSFGYSPTQSTYRDYIFTIRVTSSTTADVFLTVSGTDYRAYNLTLNGSGNIDAFSIYGSDMWDGDSNDDAFWKQTCTVENTGRVEAGYFLASGTYTPGVISDGLAANSTSTTSVNALFVGGDAGSAVILNQANTYTGATTVNANGTLRLGASSTASTSGPLGTTAGGTTVSSGGVLDMNGNSLTSSATESLTINGTGISSGGALINSNTTTGSTVAGTVALGSATSVGGAGNLTLSGVVSGGFALTKVGAGTLTLSNSSNSYSGGTVISGGTVSVSDAGHLGNTSGAITIGNGGTSTTLDVASTLSRTALNVIDGSSAGVINVASGQTFTLTNLNTPSGTSNTTKFGKSGPGTLTLSGSGTYTGQTQIGAGSVIVSNNAGLGTNSSTTARGIDLGLNVGDVSQGNNVSVLATTGITVPQSIYVAPNTSSATRTIGLSGSGTATFSNEIYIDPSATASLNGGSGSVTFSGALVSASGASNTGAVSVTGGTVVLSGANIYGGATTVTTGTLLVNGSTNASSAVTVASGARLGGSGTVSGAVSLSSGTSRVAPGSAATTVGTLTTGAFTFNSSNEYEFDITNVSGTAGTNWDLLTSSGAITISATSGAPVVIRLSGNPTGFASCTSYTWRIAGGTSISSFAANKFSINTTSFTPSFTGTFSVTNSGNDINLVYTPTLPQGSLTANGPFCATGAGQLTWTATSGTGPYTVVYNDGTASRTATSVVSGTAFATFTTPVTSTTTYTLVSVTDSNTCVRSSGFTGSSATITVNQNPTASNAGADQTSSATCGLTSV